ncbi:hypothetical protein [Arthrobacter sp. OAP107]|uniref:IS1096 element passenger TnpR family protein n=1 Tax=Arthrobacter sp. OAP107 TaxID=3156445 RepID=UPI003392F42C
MLEVRVMLVGSVLEIWRLLGIRSHMALDQVHEVLQLVFGWEDAHLHRFTPDDPFAPLRPVDGETPEVQQWLPRRDCEEPETGLRRIACSKGCSRWVPEPRTIVNGH